MHTLSLLYEKVSWYYWGAVAKIAAWAVALETIHNLVYWEAFYEEICFSWKVLRHTDLSACEV
ncbi:MULTISPECIES: hypothetical protein [unclassified Bartonella]|uniref:hypothetical protein n=1 Tax=unclassified Bartonella TaxID=2645622 RepID=UPI0035CEF6AF